MLFIRLFLAVELKGPTSLGAAILRTTGWFFPTRTSSCGNVSTEDSTNNESGTNLDSDANIMEHLRKVWDGWYVNTWRNKHQRCDKRWTDLPGSTVITIPAFKLACGFLFNVKVRRAT